ncbi:hypothetical protein ACOQFV_09155 [Nocardiopsis changdeensis]|uniref:hypothetical protein n=1 Tax=Nocardiopsis TaxID=2013 RepID=UPI002103904B|nr:MULTISPECIES: hypothetical protein [Nocardiopsis]
MTVDEYRYTGPLAVVAGAYPDWEISRAPRADRPAAWVARRGTVTLSAPTAAHLLARLEDHTRDDAELARLQEEYGQTYRVWRTADWWMGTALTDGITPTLMEPTATALEARLRNPGPRYGAPFPREAHP